MRVARYLLRRLARAVLTLLIMIAVAFALVFPVDKNPPVGDFFSHRPPFSPKEVRAVDHLFYLHQSKVLLYLHFLGQLVRGNIGDGHQLVGTHVTNTGSLGPILFPAYGATLSILFGGAVLVVLFSLPLGAISGKRVGSWADRIISFVALVLVCTHPMMLGLILRSAGGAVKWLPTGGYCPLTGHSGITITSAGNTAMTCGGPLDWSEHLALPWLTFALLFLALYTRIVRANVAETMTEDYVRTARAKGASETRLIVRHVLPSAGLRVLTMVGMEISTAIAVSIYIETAFGINGLGRLAVQLLGTPPLDLDWAVAIVTLITLLVVVGNFVVDVLYAVLDPRAGVFARPEGTKSLLGGAF